MGASSDAAGAAADAEAGVGFVTGGLTRAGVGDAGALSRLVVLPWPSTQHGTERTVSDALGKVKMACVGFVTWETTTVNDNCEASCVKATPHVTSNSKDERRATSVKQVESWQRQM